MDLKGVHAAVDADVAEAVVVEVEVDVGRREELPLNRCGKRLVLLNPPQLFMYTSHEFVSARSGVLEINGTTL